MAIVRTAALRERRASAEKVVFVQTYYLDLLERSSKILRNLSETCSLAMTSPERWLAHLAQRKLSELSERGGSGKSRDG